MTTNNTTTTILEAIHDRHLFRPWFKKPSSWQAWFAFLAALFALPMTADQIDVFQQCTGRLLPPASPPSEAWLVIGRRGGKSFMLALVAVWIACFNDFRKYLAPGERATVLVIASDRKQARIIMRYVRGLLTNIPMLRAMIEKETAEAFDLDNSVSIEIATCSFTSVRGYAVPCALCDEAAYWSSEDSAQPDIEVLNAIRPGMAQFPNAMLLVASSPYAQRGALFEAYKGYYGKDDPRILVWQAPTRRMNPTVSEAFIEGEMERDLARATAEYLGQFRTDVENLVSREAIHAVLSPGIHERAPVPGLRYSAFVDPSGGSSDSMTLAVSHMEGDIAILDVVKEIRPPFSPAATVQEFATLLKTYRVKAVTGDRYAGEFAREPFRQRGINYELSSKNKSEIYLAALALINSRRVDLLDHSRLTNQFLSLERRTSRGGRDSIDHSPGAHDDVANAVAGALIHAANPKPQTIVRAIDGSHGYLRFGPQLWPRPEDEEWNSEMSRRGLPCRDALSGGNQYD